MALHYSCNRLSQLHRLNFCLFVSDINPSREVGVQLFGNALSGVVGYAVGVFNGVGDGGNANNLDTDGRKALPGGSSFIPLNLWGSRHCKSWA